MNRDRCSTARGGSRPCHTYVRWPFSAPPPWPSTGDTGDHHRQQEPGPVEVREARGLCDGVGAQHPGQPPGRGRGQLGGCLQEVQQRHVSGLLALWPPHPRNGPTSPNPQTQGDLLWHPGHTPHTLCRPFHRFSLELGGVSESPLLFYTWENRGSGTESICPSLTGPSTQGKAPRGRTERGFGT